MGGVLRVSGGNTRVSREATGDRAVYFVGGSPKFWRMRPRVCLGNPLLQLGRQCRILGGGGGVCAMFVQHLASQRAPRSP